MASKADGYDVATRTPRRMTILDRFRMSAARSLDDLRSPGFWCDIFTESVMCAYLAALVIFVLVTCNTHHYEPSTTHFGLFAAFLIFALIEAWFPLCGGLINPAANLGFFIAGRISFARAIISTAGESAGIAAGSMIAYGLTPLEQQQGLKPILPTPGLTPAQAMGIEAIVTFNLIMVALACTTPGKHSPLVALAIGCAKGSGIMAAGTHTGGLQNPIVPFAPAVATKNFTNHFVVYWAGPFIGGAVAAILYVSVVAFKEKFKRREDPNAYTTCCTVRGSYRDSESGDRAGEPAELVTMKGKGHADED